MSTQETVSMVSETSICNQALGWLGQGSISSLQENSRAAEWMRDNYPFIRDAVLEARTWSFARERKVSTVSDPSVWGGQYVHPMPISWIAVKQVYRDVSSPEEKNWKVSKSWTREGGSVYARESTVYMRGIIRVTDTGKFTPMFVQALAARIAADSCIFFTENQRLYADKWNVYEKMLDDAAASDGQQGGNVEIQSNTLKDARMGWR